MKTNRKSVLWKAIAFLTIISFFSCTACEGTPDPPDPPVILHKAIAIIQPAENIKLTAATVVAKVIPNEDDSKVAFEMKESSQSTWGVYVLPSTYSGKDTLGITFDFYELKANTKYNFRIKVVNKAGESLSDISSFETYAVSDYDGNLYHLVTIGTQTWLRENFKGVHFANGDPIPNITGQTEWEAATSPAYCYYDNDSKYAATYGALYNWYTASDSRELIKGFHTPHHDEWRTLELYLGYEQAGGKLKEAGFAHWVEPNKGATNSTNFTGLPAGARQEIFLAMGYSADFWASDLFFGSPKYACLVDLSTSFQTLTHAGDNLNQGNSIRLLKN